MEQRKDRILATSLAKSGPKPRRKLRKTFSLKQQSNSTSSSPKQAATPTNKATATPPPRPPPAPSGNRQDEPIRREGRFYQRDPPFEPLERLGNRAYIVPEFSHLITRDPPPQSSSGSDSSTPSTTRMRRRAKTPIFSIGQLEDIPRPGNGLGRTSSVDLIAEQYRAVLESRHSSVYSNDPSEPALLPPHDDGDGEGPPLMQRPDSLGYLQDETLIGTPTGMTQLSHPSATSDDGTLVSFQDETVYFKPVSFSPGPESPLPPLSRQTTTDTTDDNVSLQICLDLLTRELSSAFAGRPCGSSAGTSALQIWVMIEAYERLRDQMAELSQGNEQARSMEMMFDMWLRALYKIHDTMTGVPAGANDYGADLGTEELD